MKYQSPSSKVQYKSFCDKVFISSTANGFVKLLNIHFTSAKMCDCCLLAARFVVTCNCADRSAALHHIVLAGQTGNEVRFCPEEEREPVLSSETPLRPRKKLFAQPPHCGRSQLFVVLLELAHLVQLEEHETSIDTLRF